MALKIMIPSRMGGLSVIRCYDYPTTLTIKRTNWHRAGLAAFAPSGDEQKPLRPAHFTAYFASREPIQTHVYCYKYLEQGFHLMPSSCPAFDRQKIVPIYNKAPNGLANLSLGRARLLAHRSTKLCESRGAFPRRLRSVPAEGPRWGKRSVGGGGQVQPVLLECNLGWGVADGILCATAHRGCHPGQEHLGRLMRPMGES